MAEKVTRTCGNCAHFVKFYKLKDKLIDCFEKEPYAGYCVPKNIAHHKVYTHYKCSNHQWEQRKQ